MACLIPPQQVDAVDEDVLDEAVVDIDAVDEVVVEGAAERFSTAAVERGVSETAATTEAMRLA